VLLLQSNKLLFLFSLFILNSALGFSQQAEFDFHKKTHRFGKVKEGEIIKTIFTFTNKGDVPLVITDYEVACTCTTVIFPENPILPKGSGEIEIIFDTNGKIGYQDRSVIIHSNSKNPANKIRFTVTVKNE
jgi:hypothetical protein